MDKKYSPSNGTKGMCFIETYCMNCLHENPHHEGKPKCEIMTASFLYDINDKEYPKEWIYGENGKPCCTNFQKWDWGNDGDPNDRDNPKAPIPEDPNQLCLPFIFDEIGIPKQELMSN